MKFKPPFRYDPFTGHILDKNGHSLCQIISNKDHSITTEEIPELFLIGLDIIEAESQEDQDQDYIDRLTKKAKRMLDNLTGS